MKCIASRRPESLRSLTMQASKTDSPFHVELAASVGKVFRDVISKDSSGLATNGRRPSRPWLVGSPAQLISLFVVLVVSSVSTTEVDRVGVALQSASDISNFFNPGGRSGRTIGALTWRSRRFL